MPEGDSVYRAARRLDAGLKGSTLVSSDLRVPSFATVDLAGRTVLGTGTHGKHLLTRFDDGRTLHTHLRMDGSWTVLGTGKRLPRRLEPQIRVLLVSAERRTAVGLSLPVVEVIATTDEGQAIGHLGPDPLKPDFDAAEAVRRLAADPDRPLAAALLDQRCMAGLGNLWVNETCFLRGASPWTPVADVDLAATVALAARMLRFSAFGTAPQVTTGDRRPGNEHWVSGRAGEPCRRCGTRIRVVAEAPGDAPGNGIRRRTWWCPSCQPGPGPGS